MPPFIPNKWMFDKYKEKCDEKDDETTKRWKCFSFACRDMMKDQMKVELCDHPIRDKLAYTAFL
jgi:hypothetical protein